MKIVSDNIKNALKQPTTQRKGRILVNGNYYEVFNVEYYADAYNEGNVIGNTIASQLDFDLPHMDKFQTFKYFDGVWTGSSYEYIDMGTFHVFDEQDEDDFNKHITAFDNLIKFNAPFNDVGGYPKTLFQELQNVCNQAGVNLQNMSIANGDFQVVNNQFVNGESLKTVLKAICQISGTYATIKNDGLVLQLKNQTNEVINKEQHQPITWKRKTYGINQVVLGMSDVEGEYVLREDTQDIEQNGVHKLVINDNPFAYTQAKRDELIDSLFNQVRGFGYIPYEMNCEWLSYLDVGDIITLDDIETIVLRINGKSPKSLESSMSAPAVIDSSITYIDNTETVKNQLKRTEIIVDKNNQSIQSVVEQTEEQNQKIAHVTQTVEELNSKISDIADITTSAEDTDAKIELNEINQSEPIRLVVRPIGESISNLIVSSNMLISNNLKLKQRVIRFTNTNTNEVFDYPLPDDLWYYDSENYDEFILDYDGQSCVINKKVGLNEDGNVYLLENPTTIKYEFPTGDKAIILTEGNYTVEILGYDTGYIFARLMAKNIYTTQFYTKSEVDSEISQTAQSINLSVNQKLSNYSTTNEMNSAIQLSASNITSNVSQNYATKTAVENIENTLDTKIEQTANSITNTVSQTYSTKTETATAKKEAINSVNASTDAKLKNYSTTTQMKSEIKQTADAINLEVAKKVDGEDVVSTINQSAEQITLKSNRLVVESTNFKLTKDGKITAISGDVGGFSLGKNKFEAKIYTDYDYTEADRTVVYNIIMNGTTPTKTQLAKYDFNGDGKITSLDYVILFKILESGVSTTNNGLLTFNTNKAQSTIELIDGNGLRVAYIDLWGSLFDRLYANNASITNLTVDNFTNNSDKRLKEDIRILDDKYENLLKEINPVSFKYKNTGNEHIGFIAQEVIEALEKNNLPQIPVKKDELGFYSLNYLDFIGILWKSNQNLIARVEKLEEEIEVLKNEK